MQGNSALYHPLILCPMKKEFFYTPDNLEIFPGFYESLLYNSDTEYSANCGREEGEPEREIKDWAGFTNDVCKGITDVLRPILEREPFCTDVEYDGMTSPRYYNYSTDKLDIKMQLDLDALKEWVLSDEERRDGFDKYLREKYTSYDGFMSFVENDIDDYFEKSYEEYPDVLVDYYVLCEIFDNPDVVDAKRHQRELTGYTWDIYEVATDCFWYYFVPVETDDDDDDDDD